MPKETLSIKQLCFCMERKLLRNAELSTIFFSQLFEKKEEKDEVINFNSPLQRVASLHTSDK